MAVGRNTKRFDLVVLGGGTAGLVAAHTAATVGARVALVERARTGGECLWTGCVPSKTLLAAGQVAHRMRTADEFGLPSFTPTVDLAAVADRIRAVQSRIEPHDSPERLRAAGVDVVRGHGRLEGAGRVRVGERLLTTRATIVATGVRPTVPPIDGLAEAEPLTTDTLWDALADLPERLLILGAGPVGTELAQALARLGRHVTLVEVADRCLPGEEPDASRVVTAALTREAVDVRPATRITSFRQTADGAVAATAAGDEIATDRVIVATGRRPNTGDVGLDSVGVRTRADGAVAVDRTLRTTGDGVYAAGDVTGVLPFTHVAAAHGLTAAVNALFLARRKVSHRTMPWVTFTDPAVARVGMMSDQARSRWGDDAHVVDLPLDRVDRALTDASPDGFIRLVGDGRGRLRGATVVAPHAGEVIAVLADTARRGESISAITKTIRPYPTYAIGVYQAAGEHVRNQLATPGRRRLSRWVLAPLRLLAAVRTRLRR